MTKFKDLTGQKFNRLEVIKLLGKNEKGRYTYLCRCDCGKLKEVMGVYLTTNQVKSCGCLMVEESRKNALKRNKGNKFGLKHGKHGCRLYRIWKGMNERCSSSNKNYGGRGIRVCEEWKTSFQNFYKWSMANGYNPDVKRGECTIDRIDNNGNYEPSNCRWVDFKTQSRNKRSNRVITFRGETKTLAEWSTITGINRKTITTRIDELSWSIEKALTTPPRKRFKR